MTSAEQSAALPRSRVVVKAAVLLAALLTLAAMLALAAGSNSKDLEQQSIAIGPHAFMVEVASTPAQRQRGLMGRTHLAADHGMLFVFERPGQHCFWMRDTPIPLSIAFVDEAGRIDGLADMTPRSEAIHCPKGDARYALEVRQGEFKRRGIQPGMRIAGLPERK